MTLLILGCRLHSHLKWLLMYCTATMTHYGTMVCNPDPCPTEPQQVAPRKVSQTALPVRPELAGQSTGQSAKKTMQLDGSATLPSQKHQILNWFILVSNGFHLRERRDKVETMKCESNENHLRIILLHEPLQ